MGKRDRVVLAALAVRPGDVLTSDRLADALWGEAVPPSWPKVGPTRVRGTASQLPGRSSAGVAFGPPRMNGGFMPRTFNVTRSYIMITVDFTKSPLIPIASAFCLLS